MRRRALIYNFLFPLFLFPAYSQASTGEAFQDRLLREHLWNQTIQMPKSLRPTVGLVLSAGSFRGLAHLGVIQVLEDAGFPIDVVAGTSMGAIVGALYAGGVSLYHPKDLNDLADPHRSTNFSSLHLFWLFLTDHLMSTKKIESFIAEFLGNKDFYQLAKPFACVAMDIKTGEEIIFREGPLAPAVRASMDLPGLFAPVEYRHRYLVDGGVVDYIPIDAARLLGAQWIIASVTEGDYTKSTPTNVLLTLEQIIDIRGALISREQRRQADIVIEPAVGDIQFYQSERSQEAMKKGVTAAKQKLREAKESLIFFSLPKLWKLWFER
jgi:NTE family protein